ncbi:uncharacterized protein CBL_03625 [Carabus blaptoides fortunei]
MVTNHPKCIVQSYLQWLQDSDYNPICELCTKDLSHEDCIRLTCYHVYHWSCLDHLAREFPSTTAPAGYTCPSCRAALFPASNLVSPVADVLREKLAGVNWARAGLGLPLLSEDREQKPSESKFEAPTSQPVLNTTPPPSHSVVHVEDHQVAFSRSESFQGARRSVFQDMDDAKRPLIDHDEDKYKRRPAAELVKRWWKNMSGLQTRNRGGGGLFKRYCMAAILVIGTLIALAIVFSRLGHLATDNDPVFDPINNPNIRVQHMDTP